MVFTIVLLMFLLFSILLLLIITSAFLAYVMTRVPFVRTPNFDLDRVIELGHVTHQDVVYDLGSGDGKVLFYISKKTGSAGVGFELGTWMHLLAKLKQKFNRTRNRFVRGNFFKHSWSEATVVYCYLYPYLMPIVGEKIKAECQPGTRIVVRDFPIPNLAQRDYFVRGKHEIFVYVV